MISMDDEIVKILMEKKDYYKYLKENSEWVKLLRRDKNNFKNFVKYVKEKYGLTVKNKVQSSIDKMEVLSEVLSSIK